MNHPLYLAIFAIFMLSAIESTHGNILTETQKSYAITEMSNPNSWSEFGDGLIHGIQRYENATSECGGNIGKLQSIYDAAVDIYKDFISGKLNPAKFVAFVTNAYQTLNLVEETCHFVELIADTIALVSPISLIIRLAYIVFIGSWTIVPSSFYFIYYLFQGDSYNTGLHVGRILKYVLSYEME